MKRLLIATILSLLWAASAFSQNFYSERAISPQSVIGIPTPVAAPIPYANVRVCTLPLTQTFPCLPLANITDQNGVAISNSIGGTFGQLNADVTGFFIFGCSANTNYRIQVQQSASNTGLVDHSASCPGFGNNFGSSLTFSGNNSHNGTETFTGPILPKTLANTVYITTNNEQGWAGADPCAWITSAQAALPSTGGIVDARGMLGTQTTCAGTFSVGANTKPVTLLLGQATFTVQNTITVWGASKVLGAGSNNAGPFPTRIIAGASFPNNSKMIQIDNSQITFNVEIGNITLDCASKTGCGTLDTGDLQDTGYLHDLWMTGYMATSGGCLSMGASAPTENFSFERSACIASSSAVGVTSITLNNTGDHFYLNNIGVGANSAGQQTTAIQCTGCNLQASTLHVENHADGVLFTGAGGTASISEIDGLSNITNVVHVASSYTGSISVLAIKKNSATNAWKNDVAVAGITGVCTEENAGWYFYNGVGGSTVWNSCPTSGLTNGLGHFYNNNGFIIPNGAGLILIDNTPGHIMKAGIGPNVTGNDQVGFFDYTHGKTLLGCSGLTPFACSMPSGPSRAQLQIADQGTACANGNIALSAGWGATATTTAAAGQGQTCQWTITSQGAGQAANPTITWTVPTALPSASVVCSAQMVGGTGVNTLINQTTLSATAPVFTFNGTPVAASTYFVVIRCGP